MRDMIIKRTLAALAIVILSMSFAAVASSAEARDTGWDKCATC